MKTVTNIIYLAIAVFAFACFALLPKAQAVSPAPDGGYPGGNTAEGTNALFSLTTGGYNTANGWNSLHTLRSGSFNTGIGAATLFGNTGDSNTATGAAALFSNTSGSWNTAYGALALLSNTEGTQNTANGYQALFNNTIGGSNTANGAYALESNTEGIDNMADGFAALHSNTTGSTNTAVGYQAGGNLTTGNNNIDIGYEVFGVAGESNTIRIGNTNITDTYIRGISGATASGGAAVFVNGNGKLGTMTSSARFKDDIKPMGNASEAILALKPVSFRYKKQIDPKGIPEFGLIAEEVEKINPDLVVRDKEGKPYSVRYDQVNTMLLNEFLKEHKRVGEQQSKIENQETTIAELKSTVAQQQKGMEILTAQLKEQAAQIQKVSARLEMSKGGLQTIANNQ